MSATLASSRENGKAYHDGRYPMIRWPDRAITRWPDHPITRSPDHPMARWPDGPMARLVAPIAAGRVDRALQLPGVEPDDVAGWAGVDDDVAWAVIPVGDHVVAAARTRHAPAEL